ncbi:MAG: response regulator [Bryobacterales bacterium]|nr:response regulator [Bryobacterales bacterium]
MAYHRRFRRLAAVPIGAALLLWAAGLPGAAREPLRIACTECPPFGGGGFASPMSGYSLDVIAMAANRLKIPYRFQPVTQSLPVAIRTGEADISPRYVPESGVTDGLAFSEPWLNMQYCLLSRKGWQPAAGARIAYVGGAFLKRMVEESAPRAAAVPGKDSGNLLHQVCTGEADAAFLESRVMYSLLLRDREGLCAGIDFQTHPASSGLPAALMTRPDHASTARKMRDEIGRMAADGSLARLHAQWFLITSTETAALDSVQQTQRSLTVLWVLVAVCGGILCALIYRLMNLRQAQREAEQASMLKSRFVRTVSHQLRTPISGIVGVTGILADTPLTSRQSELVRTVRSSSQALIQMLDDLLDLTKVEAGQFKALREPFELRSCIDEVSAIVSGQAAEHGATFTTFYERGVPRWIRGDAGRLRQVLINLLGTAVRSGGAVSLKIDIVEATPFQWTLSFSVSDSGPALDAGQLAQLFPDFEAANWSTTNGRRGGGFGLAVSRKLVEAMGGRIEAENRSGTEGLRIAFQLPFEVTGESEYSLPLDRTPVPPRHHGSLRVLVCEDDPVNRHVALHLLAKLSHRADAVATGLEAVEAARRSEYDLVLMDCNLPDIDGYEAAKRIRAEGGASAAAPVVALTAATLAEDRRRCTEAGMVGFLAKPVSLAALAAALDRAGGGSAPLPASYTTD